MASVIGNSLTILADIYPSLHNIITFPLLLPLLLTSLSKQKNSPNTSSLFKDEYDYIIVGAGAAGSVVAARLSEISCVNVLLLEAGPPPTVINDVPAFGGFFLISNKFNWKYKTVPLKHTGLGLINNQAAWPSGKGIGGGTILNAMLYARGDSKVYDHWEAMGAKGWSYKEIFKYFIKMENNIHQQHQKDYHGTEGPVTIMKPSYNPEIKEAIFQAGKELGYESVDPNTCGETGIYETEAYLRDCQRCSTAKAYLVPAENRTNLDILANAMVEKVIIENRQATGVTFSYRGKIHEVKARREVILSAGTVNTAKLLMLSGIGPKEELKKHNIPSQAHLPVGQNLQDHVGGMVNFVLGPHIEPLFKKITDTANVHLYINNRTGPLCSPYGVSNLAFLHNDDRNGSKGDYDYELVLAEEIVCPMGNMKPQVYEKVYLPYQFSPAWMCLSTVLQPRSFGNVTLRSADPYDEPVIDPNYLEDPKDVDTMVEGMKTCKRIGTSRAMRKIGSQPFETLYPGCEEYTHDDDLYFRCQVRHVILAISHPVGTARMGDPEDPSTVVDPELRVKTIRGLRVVDNSVMPKITTGNTATPAIVIGEKASDMIKETIQCHKRQHDEPLQS